jgi:putative nucleotidyltransferase with HDIG domain
MTSVEQVITRVRDLPSLPAVVVELLSSVEQEDIDTHALAAKITLDQGLTAKTLRLANSSFYGMPAKVTTIHQAISVLGFHSIRTLVTACSVTASFAPGKDAGFDLEGFWRHSIGSAVCARVLAPHFKLNPDTAFTAGLLHDLGTLVLATGYPDEYRRVGEHRRRHDCQAAQAEQAVFGLDHAAVGSALAAHWKFPLAIQRAVAGHHQPGLGALGPPGAGAAAELPATVVCLANVLAHALDLSEQEDDQVPPLPLALWRALPLGEREWHAVFEQTELTFHDLCQVLTP